MAERTAGEVLGEARPTRDALRGHAYDGIEEYDNPLPRWWVGLFWGSILFSILYVPIYHFGGPGASIEEQYDREVLAAQERMAAELLAAGPITDETLAALADDAGLMRGAERIFKSKCAQCHGLSGEGNIGPNLTDPYWLHGGRLTDIFHTISEGVPDKGMLAWKRQLTPAELMAVAAYVNTLQGTDPPGAKAPQGELFVPEQAPAAESPSGPTPAEPAAEQEAAS